MPPKYQKAYVIISTCKPLKVFCMMVEANRGVYLSMNIFDGGFSLKMWSFDNFLIEHSLKVSNFLHNSRRQKGASFDCNFVSVKCLNVEMCVSAMFCSLQICKKVMGSIIWGGPRLGGTVPESREKIKAYPASRRIFWPYPASRRIHAFCIVFTKK